jgi:hypothetical protein
MNHELTALFEIDLSNPFGSILKGLAPRKLQQDTIKRLLFPEVTLSNIMATPAMQREGRNVFGFDRPPGGFDGTCFGIPYRRVRIDMGPSVLFIVYESKLWTALQFASNNQPAHTVFGSLQPQLIREANERQRVWFRPSKESDTMTPLHTYTDSTSRVRRLLRI